MGYLETVAMVLVALRLAELTDISWWYPVALVAMGWVIGAVVKESKKR